MVPVNANLSSPSHPSAGFARRSTHAPRAVETQTDSDETTSPAASTGAAEASNVPDFRDLFTGIPTPEAPQQPQPNSAPTAESVFGENPWIANPTGTGPAGGYSYNPIYFATPQTAAKVAQMLGGTVVEANQFTSGGAFAQQQPNEMVQLANGNQVNAGLVAAFYTHGYPQSYIDQLIANTVNNT